jgi:hypothetical protein
MMMVAVVVVMTKLQTDNNTHCWYNSDEKLATICIGTCICHAQSLSLIMSKLWMEFIFKFSTPDAFSSSACPCMRKNKHFSM